MFIRTMKDPVLAQVVGHSEHGDAYRRITYDCDGKTVLCCNFCACKCACMVVVQSPRGGVGDRHLATVPQGGSVFLGVGNDKGGGGTLLVLLSISNVQTGEPIHVAFVEHVQLSSGEILMSEKLAHRACCSQT